MRFWSLWGRKHGRVEGLEEWKVWKTERKRWKSGRMEINNDQ